jgi:hypothetical protein
VREHNPFISTGTHHHRLHSCTVSRISGKFQEAHSTALEGRFCLKFEFAKSVVLAFPCPSEGDFFTASLRHEDKSWLGDMEGLQP